MDMRWACLLLFLLLPIVCSQPGFVSIKCCATSNTTDNLTEIQWMSDSYLFGNVGRCRTVSVPSVADPVYKSARVFDTNLQSRWCHDLSVVQGQEYLLRATFLHGPMLRSFAETSFNISIGAISLSRINSSINFLEVEGIFAVSDSHTEICLLKEKGNAYISMVELRPLTDSIYLDGSSSTVLKLVSRIDLGNKHGTYRHPQDLADRIWRIDPYLNKSSTLTSLEAILHGANSSIPLEVLRTAKVDPKRLEFLHTDLDTTHDDYLIILFFLELSSDVETGERIFDIYVNGERKYERMDILEKVHASNYRQVPLRVRSNGYLNISLVKVSDTINMGPSVMPMRSLKYITELWRQSKEMELEFASSGSTWPISLENLVAMAELKKELVAKNQGNLILQKWNGDPCLPSPWEGVLCKERNSAVVITKLDLSSKSFQGPIPTIIGNLTELEELDLQRNNFTGTVPDSFVSLPHLSKLSIGCNPYLNNKLPVGLSGRMDLTVDFESCSSQDPSKAEAGQIYVIGSITGGFVAFSLVLGIFFTCCYKRARHPNKSDYPVIKNAVFSMSSINEAYLNPIVQSFTLQYIENATCNYKTMIGEGGFGPVYRGTLPNGQEIAVKVRSATSTQGTREFDNEVTFLSAIRHENLVPLLGYCCENDQQILVYPFMSNGSLQDRLYGEGSRRKVLDWPTRLSIALGAARGITYLHNFAGRCIIHRDIKSSNILLDHSMCGKVADFGFSKYAPQEGDSGASLEVRGTAGYLDPEYYSTQQLSTKSDVFSFGVVLLEIVTGREPLNIHRPRNEWSLVEWAKPFFRESRIDEIVDPSIRGGYHAEAMWRVVETALTCLEPFSTYRPNMVDIVRELEDALIIENNASEYMRSIESMGDSRRHYYSMELKVLPTIPSPTEPSPNYCQIVAAPQPR